MKRRLTSLVLLLVLFGGAFAGLPLNFGDNQCCMGGMMEMECCKAMLRQQSQTKWTHEEELLCAVDCAQNGTTLPSNVVRVPPPALTLQVAHPAVAQPLPESLSLSKTITYGHSPPGSPPTYLRNLTLRI